MYSGRSPPSRDPNSLCWTVRSSTRSRLPPRPRHRGGGRGAALKFRARAASSRRPRPPALPRGLPPCRPGGDPRAAEGPPQCAARPPPRPPPRGRRRRRESGRAAARAAPRRVGRHGGVGASARAWSLGCGVPCLSPATLPCLPVVCRGRHRHRRRPSTRRLAALRRPPALDRAAGGPRGRLGDGRFARGGRPHVWSLSTGWRVLVLNLVHPSSCLPPLPTASLAWHRPPCAAQSAPCPSARRAASRPTRGR